MHLTKQMLKMIDAFSQHFVHQKKMQTETCKKQNAEMKQKRNDNNIQLSKFANKSVRQKCKIHRRTNSTMSHEANLPNKQHNNYVDSYVVRAVHTAQHIQTKTNDCVLLSIYT